MRQAATVKMDHEILDRYLRSDSPLTIRHQPLADVTQDLALTSKDSLVDDPVPKPLSSPTSLETSTKRKRDDLSESGSSDSELSDVPSDTDDVVAHDSTTWSPTLRFQAFAKLDNKELKQLIVRTGIEKGSNNDWEEWHKVAKQLAAKKIPVPEKVGDPRSVITMKWANLSCEDLAKMSKNCLEAEVRRLGIVQKRTERRSLPALVTKLKDYVPGTRKAVNMSVKKKPSPRQILRTKAREYGISWQDGHTNKKRTSAQLKLLIEARDALELERKSLEPDPNLPTINIPQAAGVLVIPCVRYSSSSSSADTKTSDLATLDDIENALRAGNILSGL